MAEKSKWTLRRMKCPEGKEEASLLVEWRVEKGKKVLRSVSCGHPRLTAYDGASCQWICLEKLSGKRP